LNSGYPNYDKLWEVAKHGLEVMGTPGTDAFSRWGIYVVRNGSGFATGYNNNEGANLGSKGGQNFDDVINAAHDAGKFEWIPNTHAYELIVLNGVVSGVRTIKGGQPFNIKAKKTILATGGFSRSAEKLANVAADLVPNLNGPMAAYNNSTAAAGAIGTGIDMAEAVGAKLYGNWVIHLQGLKFDDSIYSIGPLSPAFAQTAYGTPAQLDKRHQIVVNNVGKRFTNEAAEAISYGQQSGGRALFVENKPPYWIIYDSNNPNTTTPAANRVELTDALELVATSASTEVVKGASIPALATAMGLTGQAATDFANTVAAYNASVDSKVDEYKTTTAAINTYLDKKIETGPFYAAKFHPESHISMGGPVTDELGRVLDTSDVVIPNLYAVGELSNREFYNVAYNGAASLALYPTWGYIAGKHAANSLK
jgi:fumarate reductase flavoprotein subunit